MPLYEYKCTACAHRFERIVKFSDAPLKICPKCGKNAIEQLISASAMRFKGSGWYVTDYAHKNTGSSSEQSDSAKQSGSPPVSASSDSGGGNGKSSETSASTSSDKTASTASSAPTGSGSPNSSNSGPSGNSGSNAKSSDSK